MLGMRLVSRIPRNPSLCAEQAVDVGEGAGGADGAERAVARHLVRGRQAGGPGHARESAADADAPDAGLCQLPHRASRDAEDVDGPWRDRAGDGADAVEIAHAGRVETVGAGRRIGRETPDRLAKIRAAGGTVSEPRPIAYSSERLADVIDPNGVRIELTEQAPNAIMRKAIESWK